MTLMRAGLALAAGLFSIASVHAQEAAKPAATTEVSAKDLTFDRSKGNCLACHALPTVPDAESPGNMGPPLVAMKARFPDRAQLRAQIWDATKRNPNTSMPPFGKHKVLTEEEIDKITDYIHSL